MGETTEVIAEFQHEETVLNYGEDCDNCIDDSPKRLFKGKKRNCNSFGIVCDPIAEEIKDLRRLNLAYSEYNIVPFFDDGDANLQFFRKTKTYSPTHGACINSICDYVIGGEFVVGHKKRSGFARRKEREITDSEHDDYIDYLESFHPDLDGETLLEEVKGTFENWKTYGNAFIRIDSIQVAGETFVMIYNIDCEMCRYHYSRDDLNKTILISPLWSAEYLNQYPPEFVGVYPNVSEYEDGRKSTIIHIKNKVTGRDWYGEPDSLPSLYFQYLEIQLGQYSTEGYANDFTPRAFIEVTGDPEDEESTQAFHQAVDDTFTNSGTTKKKVMTRVRNLGDEEAKIHEFKGNNSHEFHSSMAEEAERQIIKTHNWHKTLMGIPTAGKLSSEKEFPLIFANKFKNVIRPIQKKIIAPYNLALKIADMWTGKTMSSSYTLDLGNLHENYMNETNMVLKDDPLIDDEIDD